MKTAVLAIAIALICGGEAFAEDQVQPWPRVLEVVAYAETARASLSKGCENGNPLAGTAAYLVICPKLKSIPPRVIEAAALPYLKKHLSVAEAQAAINFYTSPIGRGLMPKILREIETGKYDQLSAEDLQQMDKVNKTAFGQALKRFGMDKEANVAVVRAMLAYGP